MRKMLKVKITNPRKSKERAVNELHVVKKKNPPKNIKKDEKRKKSTNENQKGIASGSRNTARKNSEKYVRQKKLAAERQRKRRAKMTAEELAIKKRKDRERYHKKKEKKIILPISERSPRDQRLQRKEWRKNSKTYRTRKSLSKHTVNLTPPKSENENEPHSQSIPSSELYLTPQSSCNTTLTEVQESKQKTSAKKQSNQKRAKAYRIIQKQNNIIKQLQRKLERYKKRYHRQKNQSPMSPSPRRQANNLLKDLTVTKEVRKQLTCGFALKKQLEYQAKAAKAGTKKQQLFAKMIGNKILKKYRMQSYLKGIVSYKMNKRLKLSNQDNITNYVRKKRVYKVTESVKKSITDFLQDDRVSRMCPGKKEFVKCGKEKKQRRVLLDTLKNLHKKFITTTNINVSYATFCREKPFWVQKPRIQDRDTCACVKHTNMELLFLKLRQMNVVHEKSITDMLNSVCCSPQIKECMQNICDICQEKTLNFAFEKDIEVKYYQWENITEEKNIKGHIKKVRRMIKCLRTSMLSELIQKFNEEIPKFKKHVFCMQHQAKQLKEKKENLRENEILFHIDFAENYVAKFSTEPQTMHFGASKVQISLQTGIFYSCKDGKLQIQSFCTVSDNLDHQAHAVWAHLQPILQRASEKNPRATNIHFFSDSPSSQYRNRRTIYGMQKFVPEYFHKANCITWNFTESGHGKGPMDGVGGTLKRMADEHVLRGCDVTNASDFIKLFQDSSVIVLNIKKDKINDMKREFPSNLFPIEGIMQVHQIVWSVGSNAIFSRKLSCFNCLAPSQTCNHYGFSKHNISSKTEHKVLSESDNPSIFDNYSDEVPSVQNITSGTFVLAKLVTERKNQIYKYVGICQGGVDEEGDVRMTFMNIVDADKFIFKPEERIYDVPFENILCVLKTPELKMQGNRLFYQFTGPVDIYEA